MTFHRQTEVALDLGIPAGDGFVVLDTLKTNIDLASIPVIVLSGRDRRANEERVLNAGAKASLQKPVESNEFLAVSPVGDGNNLEPGTGVPGRFGLPSGNRADALASQPDFAISPKEIGMSHKFKASSSTEPLIWTALKTGCFSPAHCQSVPLKSIPTWMPVFRVPALRGAEPPQWGFSPPCLHLEDTRGCDNSPQRAAMVRRDCPTLHH